MAQCRIKPNRPVKAVNIQYTERPRLTCTVKAGVDGGFELSLSGLSPKDMNALVRGLDRLGDLHGITMHEALKHTLQTLGAIGVAIMQRSTTP